MAYLIFELSGDMAMWRNPYEPMGSFSCLGPAPSNIAGLIGAALGYASPCSQGIVNYDEKYLNALNNKGLPWPVSKDLLQWENDNNYHVACRWRGGFPRRVAWNINGYKDVSEWETLRLQQQVIDKPVYEIALKLNNRKVLEDIKNALVKPIYSLYLGASFCRAILKHIRINEDIPDGGNWAIRKDVAFGETTPFSLHVINFEESNERIYSDGYWLYPTPSFPGEIQIDPFVKGYYEKKL